MIKTHNIKVVTALVLILAVGDSVTSAEPAERNLPNILLVVVDSLRYDHLGCYGYDRDTSPFIDELAAQGVLFERVYSTSSWTTPSVMSMFTSVLPRMHSVVSVNNRLQEGYTTLAAELSTLGYTTIAVTVNPSAASAQGFDRGFDVFDDYSVLLEMQFNVFDIMGTQQAKSIHEITTSQQLTDLALLHLRKVPEGKPWFLFLFYFDPHADYVPPPSFAEMFDSDYGGDATGKVVGKKYTYVFENQRDLEHVVALYDGEIRFTDDQFRRFMETAAEEGLLGHNLFTIITSDHGEEFNEHGGLQHGRTLFEEVVRLPLIMHWPNVFPSGKRVKVMVSIMDIKPTILSALKTEVPAQCLGVDLLPPISGEGIGRREFALHVESIGHYAGIVDAHRKAILDLFDDSVRVYDLKEDSLELSPIQPEVINQCEQTSGLVNRLIEWNRTMELEYRRRMEVADDDEGPQLTPQQIEALRSMGYLH